MFYTQSVVSSLHFIPSMCFIPSPQSVVRSPQSMFYTDRKNYASERSEFFIQTQMNLLGGLSHKILIFYENILLSSHMKRLPLLWLHINKWHLSQSAKWFGISLVFILIINRTLNGHLVTLLKKYKN